MYDGNRLHEGYDSLDKVLIMESQSCCAKKPALLRDALEQLQERLGVKRKRGEASPLVIGQGSMRYASVPLPCVGHNDWNRKPNRERCIQTMYGLFHKLK